MTFEQLLIFGVLAATVAMFLWGRWRHDMVALGALLACVATGLVPAEQAFAGFGHPAVITVAAVLVLSYGLQTSGAVDALTQRVVPSAAGPTVTIAALVGLGAFLSAFMNNVGAMALLMPVAVHVANRHQLPPGKVLMPLAFGTILGGMTTLIGTPPNLIVSAFRAETGMGSFAMFDFSPVGLIVLGVAITFILGVGWRIVPARQAASAASFDTGTYLTEVRVTELSKVISATLREVEAQLEEADAQIVGMIRNDVHVSAPNPGRVLRRGDILIIEADPEALAGILANLGLKLEEEVAPEEPDPQPEAEDPDAEPAVAAPGDAHRSAGPLVGGHDGAAEKAQHHSDGDGRSRDGREITLQELVAMPGSRLIGRSASDVMLRTRYGLNLLAISRQGRRSISRLRSTRIMSGDVLLMQGGSEALSAFASEHHCVPLAQRAVRIPDKRKAMLATVVMLSAIAGAAFGLLPAAVSFTAGMLAYMALRIVPPRNIYDAIDWPVIVLLGSLIPVAAAMATTGAADLLARVLLDGIAQGHPIIALTLVLVVTMTLSDFMNNAATAAVMCPIAISAAMQLGVSADSFLMAVAIGASCAFLTPIGHQNNTLILGPGGFRFGDYWRLGLPVEILVVAVSVPALLWIWPL
ncbi:MAG: SLC13 family permease [Pseudomonadales bacterium]